MASIKQPGVSVEQEFTATTPTVTAPTLVPLIIGPCYHVQDAINSSNNTFNSDAKAGTYYANIGTQSFSLPGLASYTGAILDTASVKVYLDTQNGTPQAALRSVSDESILLSGTGTATLTANTNRPRFTVTGVTNFKSYGVTSKSATQKGDVVRITYLGRSYDLEIVDLLDSTNTSVVNNASLAATKLELSVDAYSIDGTSSVLDSPLYDVSLSALNFNIIDKPADYVVRTSAANAVTSQIGDGSANYFHFEATGAMAGSAAESNSFKVVLEAAQNESGTDSGYGDGALLIHSSAGLGSATAGDTVLWDAAGGVAGTYDTSAIVGAVINSKTIGLTTGALNGKGTNKDIIIGTEHAAEETVTFNSGTGVGQLTTTSPYNFSTATNITVGIKVGSIYYKGAIGSTPGEVTLDQGGSNAIADGSGQSITHIVVADVSVTGADEGANKFASADLGSGTSSGDYIVISGTYLLSSSTVSDNTITVSGITSQAGVSWVSVPAGAGHSDIATAAYNATSKTITISLNRDSGLLPTFAELAAGLTAGDASELDTTVSPLISVSGLTGSSSTEIDEDSVTAPDGTLGRRTYHFEGGYDANQVVLDGGMATGSPLSVYIQYRALRVDLSAAASDPSLTTIDSVADITSKIGRSDTKSNPLALAAKLALANSSSTSIKVLGLSAADSAELIAYPEGSSAAYSEALTMVESESVYSLAPLSSERDVLSLFDSHVTSMSSADNKSERICFISRTLPEYSQAKLIASGSSLSTDASFNANGLVTTGVDFGLSGANFALLSAALSAGEDVILVLNSFKTSTHAATALLGGASAQNGFRVSSVVTTNTYKLAVNTADIVHSSQTNDLSSQSWYLYTQGKAITKPADQADRIASYGSEYANRRTFLVWPSRVVANVGSNSEFLEGYYLASTIACIVGFKGVGQGFTNMTISGYTDMRYSNKHFSRSQLDQIAGGGTMIVVQDTENGPFKVRHQLATDVSTVQKRELSITKAIDYFAKSLRLSLQNRIGTFNITSAFIQSISLNAQAIIAYMVSTNVIQSGTISKIEQDSSNPDTLNLTIQVSPLYPCNYIEITLQI